MHRIEKALEIQRGLHVESIWQSELLLQVGKSAVRMKTSIYDMASSKRKKEKEGCQVLLMNRNTTAMQS